MPAGDAIQYCIVRNSRGCKGKKSPEQLQTGSKHHIMWGSSLGPYGTFWSKGTKIFVRHLGFWRPYWIFEPVSDFALDKQPQNHQKCPESLQILPNYAQGIIESIYHIWNAHSLTIAEICHFWFTKTAYFVMFFKQQKIYISFEKNTRKKIVVPLDQKVAHKSHNHFGTPFVSQPLS